MFIHGPKNVKQFRRIYFVMKELFLSEEFMITGINQYLLSKPVLCAGLTRNLTLPWPVLISAFQPEMTWVTLYVFMYGAGPFILC